MEFLGRKPSLKEAKESFLMPGGGVLKVVPGQITDDGEMLLCLASALVEKPKFSIECIASYYKRWVKSKPLDIGSTIIRTIGGFMFHDEISDNWSAKKMSKEALNFTKSKANGSLMRCAPLGIWGHTFSDRKLAKYAKKDSSLSHANPTCYHAVSCYVIAIKHLLNNIGNREKAFFAAETWANKNCQEVYEWLQNAKNNIKEPYHPYAGFVKIAFSHAFRQLLYAENYENAIIETLEGGGDSDTNACIVGGLVGTLFGESSIPHEVSSLVLNYDLKAGHQRPDFLSPKEIKQLIESLLK